MKKRIALLVAAGLLLAGGAAACSSEQHSAASNGSDDRKAPEMSVPAPATDGGNGSAGSKAGTPQAEVTLAPADVQRSIIYTGTITIRVKDVSAAAQSAVDIARGAGGYPAGQSEQIDANFSTGTVVLRVPVATFDTTVAALHNLGTELSRQIASQDVTTQVIDVQSRLKTEQASVDRIRALMASTKSIGEIVALEDELSSRESNLEAMEAQLRSLTDLTALSTITVNLYGPEAHVVTPPPPKKTGFVAGLKSGWHGFLASMTVLLTVLGAVLPFVLIIGVPVWFILRLVRRRTRRRPAPEFPALATTEEKS